MNWLIKRMASQLPEGTQQNLKRAYFRQQIRNGTFVTDEHEYGLLENWIGEGDWVIDVGANIGHYTKKLSDLVGSTGRVFAVEPVVHTFELLASNVARFKNRNVTLLNVAASNGTAVVRMAMPHMNTGLDNYYQAKISEDSSAGISSIAMGLDSLAIQHRVKLIKLDVEGHEFQALQGLANLLARDKPILIVEGGDQDVDSFLCSLGYQFSYHEGSPNRVYSAGNMSA